MPPDMEVSMRHTKMKAEEVALLAGEIIKPSWESRNEGIHERVSFEDCIWGFDLAGGSYYRTPLRVTYVKPDSRAAKAGIRPGDRLLKINEIDTATLTIQEAHELIKDSGIHLKLSVTSPDDDVDAYYCYEDPIVEDFESEEARLLEEERARQRMVHARVSSYWSLQWPWVSRKRLIYRESNCFMVNSKYEEARRDKFPPIPSIRYTDDILLFQRDGDKVQHKSHIPSIEELKDRSRKFRQYMSNVEVEGKRPRDFTLSDGKLRHVNNDQRSSNRVLSTPPRIEENDEDDIVEEQDIEGPTIEELEETDTDESISESAVVNELNGEISEDPNDVLSPVPVVTEENTVPKVIEENEKSGEITEQQRNDEVVGKNNDNVSKSDEDNILDSILSDDGQNLENSEANNER